jgi:hypothetical protein
VLVAIVAAGPVEVVELGARHAQPADDLRGPPEAVQETFSTTFTYSLSSGDTHCPRRVPAG